MDDAWDENLGSRPICSSPSPLPPYSFDSTTINCSCKFGPLSPCQAGLQKYSSKYQISEPSSACLRRQIDAATFYQEVIALGVDSRPLYCCRSEWENCTSHDINQECQHSTAAVVSSFIKLCTAHTRHCNSTQLTHHRDIRHDHDVGLG